MKRKLDDITDEEIEAVSSDKNILLLTDKFRNYILFDTINKNFDSEISEKVEEGKEYDLIVYGFNDSYFISNTTKTTEKKDIVAAQSIELLKKIGMDKNDPRLIPVTISPNKSLIKDICSAFPLAKQYWIELAPSNFNEKDNESLRVTLVDYCRDILKERMNFKDILFTEINRLRKEKGSLETYGINPDTHKERYSIYGKAIGLPYAYHNALKRVGINDPEDIIRIFDDARVHGWNIDFFYSKDHQEFLNKYNKSGFSRLIDFIDLENIEYLKDVEMINDLDLLRFLIQSSLLKEEDIKEKHDLKDDPIARMAYYDMDEIFKGCLKDLVKEYHSQMLKQKADLTIDDNDDNSIEMEITDISGSRCKIENYMKYYLLIKSKSNIKKAHPIYANILAAASDKGINNVEDLLNIEKERVCDDFLDIYGKEITEMIILDGDRLDVSKAIRFIEEQRRNTENWDANDWKLLEHRGSGAYGHAFKGENIIGGNESIVKIFDLSADANADIRNIYLKHVPDPDRSNIEEAIRKALSHEAMIKLKRELSEKEEEKKYILLPDYFFSGVRFKGEKSTTYASITQELDTILTDELKKGKYSSFEDYMPLITEILTAFSIVHKKRKVENKNIRFVHNDIKPSNIGFWKGQLKVFDFGIATTLSQRERMDYPNIGSLEMRAPELKPVGDKPTTRSDVWQIGCLIYNLVAQNNPFDYKDRPKKTDPEKRLYFEEHERPKRIKEDLPKAIQHLRDIGIKEGLVKFIDKCLKIDPKERYKDARQCLDDFKRHYDNIIKDYKK